MSNSINSNIVSLRMQKELANVDRAESRTYERLSSGLRINRASDDPAGLSLSSKLNVDTRVYSQGVRNVNDGISAVSIASSTLSQLSDVLTHLKELATQAANGVLSLTQRRAIDTEAYALTNEYNRLAGTARFNGQSLLDGSVSSLGVQAGYGVTGNVQSSVGQKFLRTVGDGTFQGKVSYAPGASLPNDIDTADFNGDGKLDIVSASLSNGAAAVLLGNGDGTFQTAVTYDTGARSDFIAVGDLNNDGRLDLAATDFSNDTVHVLFGNGDGTFQTSVSYSAGGDEPTDVQLADFNADGFLDIVNTSDNDNTVNVLLNKGDGTFGTPVSYSIGASPREVTIGDFNGDGKQDLATVATDDKAYIHYGTGNGTFISGPSYSAGSGPNSIATADLNHDGILDLVTTSSSDAKMNVLLGKGDGTFQALVSYAGVTPRRTKITDINGDGIPDIIVGSSGTSLNVYLGVGDGSFQPRVSYSTDTGPLSVTTGDFNGDGAIDLATGTVSLSKIDIFLANPAQTSTMPRLNLTTQAEARSALSTIDAAQTRVSQEQGVLGAFEARLFTSLKLLQAIRDNYSLAKSRVTDADVAQETTDLLGQQVRQNTTTSLLAQANQLPQIVLDLLRNSLP